MVKPVVLATTALISQGSSKKDSSILGTLGTGGALDSRSAVRSSSTQNVVILLMIIFAEPSPLLPTEGASDPLTDKCRPG